LLFLPAGRALDEVGPPPRRNRVVELAGVDLDVDHVDALARPPLAALARPSLARRPQIEVEIAVVGPGAAVRIPIDHAVIRGRAPEVLAPVEVPGEAQRAVGAGDGEPAGREIR